MRMFFKIGLAVIGLFVASFGANADEVESCDAKYQAVAPVAIKMPYREFDQSPEGFRKLGNCWAEASVLLKRYVAKQEYETRNVRWHLAQTLALNGDTAGAIESALLSLNPPEVEKKSTFSWNTYAQATIAFLRNDRAAFDSQYEVHRAAAEKYPENKMNLDILNELAKCFGKPYKQSYVRCEVAP